MQDHDERRTGSRSLLRSGRDGARPRLVVAIEPVSALAIGLGLVTVLTLFALFRSGSESITRIGVGLLLALALNPLVVMLQTRFGWRRSSGVLAVGAVVVGIFAVLAFVMGPPAIRQAERFGAELPTTVEQLYDFPLIGAPLRQADAAEEVRLFGRELPDRLDTEDVADTIRSVVGGLLAGLTVLLVGFAVLLDGELLVARLRQLVPRSQRDRADDVARVFYRVIGAYFAGSLLVACLAGTFVLAVGLLLGVPLAPMAALWTIMVSLIPQVGGFLSGSVFTVLGFTQGVGVGIACLALYLVYMNLENHVISPAIVGEAVDLSPPTTMLAALVGGAAAGVPGALVATPLCGTVKSLYTELRYGPVEASAGGPGGAGTKPRRRWPWQRRRTPR